MEAEVRSMDVPRKGRRTRRLQFMRHLVLLLALLLALAPTGVEAAEPRQGDRVVVGPNEVVDDDLYAFAGSVEIQGTVRGDVVAFAGSVRVTGTVTGDLMAGSGTVDVPGRVGGNVRVGAGTVTIGGPVGGDLLVGSGNLSLGPEATVGRDLLMGVGSGVVDGRVGRKLLAGAADLTLNGAVGSTVDAEVSNIRLGDRATVGGDLTYRSDREASIAPGARIQGRVQRLEPRVERPGPAESFGLAVLGWLRTLLGLFVLGTLVLLLFSGFSQRTADSLRARPWASLGIGFALFVLVPIAALVVFGIGLFLGGWWLALMALALYGIALAVSLVLAGFFTGSWVVQLARWQGVHPVLALLLGLAILLLVGAVPIVGPIVVFVATVFALGALVLATPRGRGAGTVPG